jgi:hypothetical protein
MEEKEEITIEGVSRRGYRHRRRSISTRRKEILSFLLTLLGVAANF